MVDGRSLSDAISAAFVSALVVAFLIGVGSCLAVIMLWQLVSQHVALH